MRIGNEELSDNVAYALVDVLERIGVKQIFGLIGDSLNLLADAVRPVRGGDPTKIPTPGGMQGRNALCLNTTALSSGVVLPVA